LYYSIYIIDLSPRHDDGIYKEIFLLTITLNSHIMQNSTNQSSGSNCTQQNIDPVKDDKQCIIACPIFRKELESVLAELNLSPRISYMHYTIHNNPLKMDEELQDGVDRASKTGGKVRFLVGKHCKGTRAIQEVVEDCGGKIPQARNCIDMLIGSELTNKLQKNRTSLMTPAWVKMINRSIRDGQWTVTDARVNLGWYNKILILDTGVEQLSDEQIMEFYDLTQVEIEILPVKLDHFQKLLQDLLQ
jgi:hypothetical protein